MGEEETVPSEQKQAETGICTPDESVVWSQEVEVCLFHAMLGHKPVGVNRHFHMICIRDKFSQNIGRQVPSKVIWDHLSTMYDMQALHESEILPFPNSEKNFALLEEIIQDVKEGKVESEDDMKEEFKLESDPPATHEEGLGPSTAGQDFARACGGYLKHGMCRICFNRFVQQHQLMRSITDKYTNFSKCTMSKVEDRQHMV
ncbi:MRG/MORF4L-binding protein-like isoform X2 [Myxocyprinus asiaticus]|uniref:MRG/MORF4L-binding protein-like isoform X2 n=1 Tax=Myxocyprinus asiaticus TaxID=70543 RepID=UPI002222BCB6|nr:MRG/MORF4L-binding protein-like isoform X2 [Myxocyprinus asiaticus]